jgi:hypothetical protein
VNTSKIELEGADMAGEGIARWRAYNRALVLVVPKRATEKLQLTP